MPSTIFVPSRSAGAHELSLGFHFSSIREKTPISEFLFFLLYDWEGKRICLFFFLPVSVVTSWRCFWDYNLVYASDRWACGSYVSPRGFELFGHCMSTKSSSLEFRFVLLDNYRKKKKIDGPLLNVTCPKGTSRIIGPLFSASSIHGWLQKWEFAILGAWRHMRQSVSPNLNK